MKKNNNANMAENDTVDLKIEKETTGGKYLKGLRSLGIYFLIFCVTITLAELFIRYQISGKIMKMKLAVIAFVPAEAMFFTIFAGFFKNIGNKITLPLLLFVINIYYCIQFVYFKIFGSLFSVSMMGMGGTAVGNFFWAMEGVLIASIIFLTIFLSPTLICIFLTFVKKLKFPGYPLLLHILPVLLTVGFWFGGIQLLKVAGTDRQSAYYVFKNSSSDTDSTANHLGTLATFIVESGAYYFGIGSNPSDAEIVSVDKNSLELVPDTVETVTETIDTNGSEKETAEVEEVAEEIVYDPWIDERFDFEALAEAATDTQL